MKRNLVVETFGRDILDLSERHREKAIESAFGYWRSAGFPYPQIAEPEIRREIELLCGTSPRWRYGKLISLSTVGLRLANAFHPQIWGVKGHGRSPIDCFHDNDRLRLALSKAPLFWPDRRCWNAQCVRSLMRIHHRTRVSNFRPVVARAVVERFSECGAVVLDFSAGYSGRLLGAVTLKRHYLGIDAAKAQVTGLRQTMSAIRNMVLGSGEFVHGCAEDVLALIRKESVNLVFTSPPFFRLERYSTEATQSYIRYQSYDEWKEKFLFSALAQGHRTLKRGGWLILNVNDGTRYKLLTDTRQYASKLFSRCEVLGFSLNRIPCARDPGGNYQRDYLLALQKKV